ncbi:unnamed protein product (macronuclear) [Paramecium tetraurelia]|uniref:Uncharacterized protein n=1 Tax=Paramecium tetraurelia TaxID=5888 RepID=A0D8V8_PARTE|nr:uncharacterized protein GSPATT00014421001 [Paramecium tetraurelia]CAK79475.1 unnamed protein product [Paramecium tetraurelia]|eukprot:XP_001446872.1 hypothetical protein (macronuclear) [Paramecium tetraurelia strain d4-2]
MQINKEQLKNQNLQEQKNENSQILINVICNKLHNICARTCQIKYPKIQIKKIKKNCLDFKKKRDNKSQSSRIDQNANQCLCQTCLDLKLLEYISQLKAVENLQNQLESVKELIYFFQQP